MLIREAEPDDASGIARVHVDSWRTTYKGIVPSRYLAGMSVEEYESRWRHILGHFGSPGFTYVAEEVPGRIVGFASSGDQRSGGSLSGYEGELYAAYILDRCQANGTGRRLVAAIARRLLQNGRRSMTVWVLEQNPSRRFYEALGGRLLCKEEIEIGGAKLYEVAYGWTDVTTIG